MARYHLTSWSPTGGRKDRKLSPATLRQAMRTTTRHAKMFGQATLFDGDTPLMTCQHAQHSRTRRNSFMGGYAHCSITKAGRARLRSSKHHWRS